MNQENQDELLNQLQNQQQKQLQLLKQVEALEATVKKYLTKEAITRYGTIKTAHPEKAMQVLVVLAQLIQNKQLSHKLTDQEFKSILMQMQQPQRKSKININK